jgi:ribulose-bisphosphate carboxylase large chain
MRIHAHYWLEIIAGEQSSGTFVKLAHETPELQARSGAHIERLEVLSTSHSPSLEGRYKAGAIFSQCLLELSWNVENIGASLPNLMATIAGNLFELQCVSGLRLLDVDLPLCFAQKYRGPQFGIEGTRALAGVYHAPLIGTIIKPSIGLDPQETAQEVRKLVEGGIDFIKDDELQSNGSHCPFEARVKAVMAVVNAQAQKTGKKAMVAFNITGELNEMKSRHDFVRENGGTCIMLSLNSVGLVGLREMRLHSQLPIHGHRNGWGYLSRHKALGFDYAPLQKIWRLAGADHLHVNGLNNKFSESNESVMAAARAVLKPLWVENPCAAMPVFSSGQTGLVAAQTFKGLQSADLIFAAGGGIFGHPSGVKAGVTALRQAFEAAQHNIALQDYALQHLELRDALRFW